MASNEIRLKDEDGIVISGFFLKNDILYVDLRWTKNTKKWGRNKSTGQGKEAIGIWTEHLKSMKRLHAAKQLDDKAFASFFSARTGGVLASSMKFDTLAGEWITNALPKREVEKSTEFYYGVALDCCWKPSFSTGDGKSRVSWPISQITKTEVEKVLEEGALAGRNRKTKANYMSVLRMVFEYAVEKGYVSADQNPAFKVKKVKKEVQLDIAKAFDYTEIEPFLDALRAEATRMYPGTKDAGELMYNYFEFAFFTGLRPEEMIAIQRRDLQHGSLVVRRSIVMGVSKRPKTGLSRTVKLNPRAKECLARQLKLVADKPEQTIFVHAEGQPFHDVQVQGKIWNRVADAIWPPAKGNGRERVRVRPQYATRHTSVSLSLMMGQHPRIVAEQHGHSQQVMEAVYAHWMNLLDIEGDDTGALVAIHKLYRTTPPTELAFRARIKELERQLAAVSRPATELRVAA